MKQYIVKIRDSFLMLIIIIHFKKESFPKIIFKFTMFNLKILNFIFFLFSKLLNNFPHRHPPFRIR